LRLLWILSNNALIGADAAAEEEFFDRNFKFSEDTYPSKSEIFSIFRFIGFVLGILDFHTENQQNKYILSCKSVKQMLKTKGESFIRIS